MCTGTAAIGASHRHVSSIPVHQRLAGGLTACFVGGPKFRSSARPCLRALIGPFGRPSALPQYFALRAEQCKGETDNLRTIDVLRGN
jgi:hypothetical protein